MNYANIKTMDIANGIGIRVSLFVSGCLFHCKNCFNEEVQNYNYGQLFDKEIYNYIISLVDRPFISGLSILGGDAMWQSEQDIRQLIDLCNEAHSKNKTVWLWTGFTYEEIFAINYKEATSIEQAAQDLFSSCDVVVDGKYIDEQRDLTLKWRGSKNQRVLDVKECIKQHKPVLLENEN